MSNALTYADKQYFDECLRDQNDLMVPVTLKRCVSIRRDSAYPDDPPTLEYELISFMADVREVSLQESAFSGGQLIVGDNVIWCQQQLRGPRDISTNHDDPNSIADILIISNMEWTVVGQPLIGRLKDPIIVGCQAYIRRRRGGMLNDGDPGYDPAKAQV